FSLVAEEKAFLQNGEYQAVVSLKGVDENYKYITGVEQHMVKGEYHLGTMAAPLMSMGAGVANAVGVQSDRNILALTVYMPKKIFGDGYKVQTRFEQNQGLYSVMVTEKWVIYAVLCLILIIAAFNMVGALTMLVLEKEKDISVLHALGANRHFIQKIFLSEG